MSTPLTFIIGCTCSGKSRLGFEIARRIGAEIISIDSMKVYRRMDIGTAKPSADARREVPHHLIDIVEPSEEFSVAEYVKAAERAIADIQARGRPVLIVGGTPLYLKAMTAGMFDGPGADAELRERLSREADSSGLDSLHRRLSGVDPLAASRIHPNDRRRIIRALEVYDLTGTPISTLQTQWEAEHPRRDYKLIGLRRTLEDQNSRTNERVMRMVNEGLVEEVRLLLAEGRSLSTAAKQALGYAEMIRHLNGELSLAEAVELTKINTRQFAKAQRTWFKRFLETEWIDLAPNSTALEIADQLLARRDLAWPT